MSRNPEISLDTPTLGAAIVAVSEALDSAGVCFGHGTDNAWDEAVQLVLDVAGLSPDCEDGLSHQPLAEAQLNHLERLLQRRIGERIPLPYLLGKACFAGLEFVCDERALVPRSPIAELILNDFQPWYAGPAPHRILDLCCGGGCIGLAVAHHLPESRVDLADIDTAALDLARENTALHQLESRVRILQSDLFERLEQERYDIILCNPPYVDAQDLAGMPAEYRAEPSMGLGSGRDGLDVTRRILAQVGDFLQPHGLLLLEVGNSAAALEAAFPQVAFTWVELVNGGHGVFAMTAQEWQDFGASWGL